MLKLSPAASIVSAIIGRVRRSKERRPSVSIVQTAGKAPRKFTRPNATDARRAPWLLKFASANMVLL